MKVELNPLLLPTLQHVLGIDMATLLSSDEADFLPVKSYGLDSSFYPSQALLDALAHAYGINNVISPTALHTVHYVAQQ